jgi:outer membrane protein assembly factor BamB
MCFGTRCEVRAAIALSAKSYDTPSIVMSIVGSDIDGNGEHEIITGSVDGTVRVLSLKGLKGRTLWESPVNGIPSFLCVGDKDEKGRRKISSIIQDVEGCLIVFDHTGKVLMTYRSEVTFLSLGMGDVDGDGAEEVVAGDVLGYVHFLERDGKLRWKKHIANSAISCLDIGDINNDRKSEILLGTHEDGIFALNDSGNVLWHISKRLRETGRRPAAKLSWIRSIIVDDINSDGKPEVISSSRPNGMISVFDGRGKRIWKKRFKGIINNFSTSLISVGDLTGNGKKEIVALLHGVILNGQKGRSPIYILDHAGRIVSDYKPDGNYYSLFLDDVDKDKKGELLIGSQTRSRRFYILDGYESNVPRLEGLAGNLTDNINGIVEKVRMTSGQKVLDQTSSKIRVLYSCRASSPDLEAIYKFLSELGSKDLSFVPLIEGIHERDPGRPGNRSGRGRQMSQDEILAIVRHCESRKIPFFLLAGAHCKTHIGLDTAEKILKIAPSSCRGFIFHEDSYSSSDWDYFIGNIEKVLQLCKKYGRKKLILNEHQDFWYRVPMMRNVGPKFFNSDFGDILIPMYKSNRYVMPELNLGSIFGLWKTGKVREWGFSTQDDAWKWESVFMVVPDDVILRMEVMAASLGATYFRIERGKEFLDVKGGKIALSNGARRHRDLFHSLIRKNIIRPVEDSSQVIGSPVALKHNSGNAWTGPKGPKGYWEHYYRLALTNKIFGHQLGLQSVGDEFLSRYAYGVKYYAEAIFPKTRYGFVQIVPDWIGEASFEGVRKVWKTDGNHIYDGGKRLDHLTAKRKILESLQGLEKTMPFRADGVFLSVQKFSDDYLVYLLDPGCLDVWGVDTVLTAGDSIKDFTISDAISNETLPVKERGVRVHVPAGGFRILKVATGKKAPV